MKRITEKLTLFFSIGIILLLISIPYGITLLNSHSAQKGLEGYAVFFIFIPIVLLVLFIDRAFVSKFGNKKVNHFQLIFLGILVVLWIIRFILNLDYFGL